MTWLKTDDKFPEHRKVRRLSDPAYRLHHTAMCACARDETDGLVTETDIDDMEHGRRLRKHVPTLVEAGLWDVVEGGWMVHDFLHYNPSHEKQNADRAAARERQANSRKRKAVADTGETPSVTDLSRRDGGVTHGDVTAKSHPLSQPPVPTRPDPSRPVPISQRQVANATPGMAQLGDALGLVVNR